VSAAARNKELRTLILRGIYEVPYIRIRNIIFDNDLYNFELSFKRR